MNDSTDIFRERLRDALEAIGDSTFALRLQAVLRARDLKQTTAAELLGVSQAAISRWLNGKAHPVGSGVRYVPATLGVEQAWLMNGEGCAIPQRREKTQKANTPREMLRAAREAAFLTQRELGKQINYPADYIANVENGRAPASEKFIKAVCAVLTTLAPEELMDGSDTPRIYDPSGMTGTYGSEPQAEAKPGVRQRMVPLLTIAQAGEYDAAHLDEGIYRFESILVLDLQGRIFAVRSNGDSMPESAPHGDICICQVSDPPVPDDLPQGRLVCVRTHSGNAHIKHWYLHGDEVSLESENPKHKPIKLPLEEIAGAHRIVQVIHNIK